MYIIATVLLLAFVIYWVHQLIDYWYDHITWAPYCSGKVKINGRWHRYK